MSVKHRSRAHESAQELELELNGLTTALAAEISRPAQERDPDAIVRGWNEIEALRHRMSTLAREMKRQWLPQRGHANKRDYEQAREIYEHAKTMRRRLQEMDAIRDMVMMHLDPAPVPLLNEKTPHTADPLMKMLDKAFHKLANLNPQDKKAREHTCFADIPMPARTFDELMRAAYRLLLAQGRAKEARFIDIGCGGGTRTFLAGRHFRFCDGLEYDKGYAEAGKRFMEIMGHADMRVMQGDGLTFDRYADYDVIYFYRPMSDLEKLGDLERKVIADARPGTIILAPWDEFHKARSEIDCARIEGPLFVAGLTQDEADALRHAAERTDTVVVAASRDWTYDPGFWSPLIDASSYDISST